MDVALKSGADERELAGMGLSGLNDLRGLVYCTSPERSLLFSPEGPVMIF